MSLEKRRNFIINSTYFLLSLAMVYVVLRYAFGLFTPFLIGFMVALLLQRSINLLSRKLRLPKRIVAVCLVILFYLIIGFLLSWLGVTLFAELKDLIEQSPRIYAEDIEPVIFGVFERIERIMARFDLTLVHLVEDFHVSLSQSVGKVITELSSMTIGAITSTVSMVPKLFLFIILAIVSSAFIATDYQTITSFLANLIPAQRRGLVGELKEFASSIGLKYVKAYFILMVVTFSELLVGLSIMRVQGALAIAAITAVIDILPVLGTGLVILPWGLFELIKGKLPSAVGLFLLYAVITIVRNILEPKLVGQQIGLHPLVILISMYVGARLFGFLGLFMLPFTILMLKYLYDHNRLYFRNRPPPS